MLDYSCPNLKTAQVFIAHRSGLEYFKKHNKRMAAAIAKRRAVRSTGCGGLREGVANLNYEQSSYWIDGIGSV